MKKLRLLMIGGWGHGSGMLNFIARRNPGYLEVAGLGMATRNETFEAWKSCHPFLQHVPVYQDYRRMLEETEADLAVVSSALPNIPEAVLTALRAGLSIYTEKPLAAEVETLKIIHRQARQKGLFVLFTTGNHVNPALIRIRDLVSKGEAGETVLVNARKSYSWNDDRAKQFPIAYGGTIGWVGIHAFEFIAAATGLSFTNISVMESNMLSERFADCPDNVVACLRLSNGGHASISLDYHRPETALRSSDDWIRVVGTKGTIEANMSKGTFLQEIQEEETVTLETGTKDDWFSLLPLALLEGGEKRELCRKLTETAFHLNHTAIIGQQAAREQRVLPVPAEQIA